MKFYILAFLIYTKKINQDNKLFRSTFKCKSNVMFIANGKNLSKEIQTRVNENSVGYEWDI
jgi:hypothetical protein